MVWFYDCGEDPKKIEERRKKLLQFSEICGIIENVIEKKIENLDSVTEKDYESPSWAYKQAHKNGEKQAYKEILDLISFPKE